MWRIAPFLTCVLLAWSASAAPLHDAVLSGDIETVRSLIADGAELDPINGQGQTPLFIALDRGRVGSAMALLDAGADIGKLGGRAMAMAVRTGNTRMVMKMIELGAAVDLPDRAGHTPLVQAVRRGSSESALALLRVGADPNVAVSAGVPLLCWASANGRAPIVTQLLAGGVDITARDTNDRNSLDLALVHDHASVADHLRTAGLTTTPGHTSDGAAAWLRQPLAAGEAQLWHLGHCGWAIRTRDNLLVFDYFPPRKRPAQPGLANGFLSADELAGLNVTVFVTHGHRDHFDPAIYALADLGATFVYGFEPGSPGSGSEGRYTGPAYIHTPPRIRREVNGIVIETITSNDLGVGFVVTVDGVTLYHAGDHAGWRDDEKAGFTNEIDHIAALGHTIAAAFLNVTGCHAHGPCPLEDGTSYTLNKLKPKVWFPTHAGGNEYKYAEFADRIAGRKDSSRIICPIYRGDFWEYRNGELRQP